LTRLQKCFEINGLLLSKGIIRNARTWPILLSRCSIISAYTSTWTNCTPSFLNNRSLTKCEMLLRLHIYQGLSCCCANSPRWLWSFLLDILLPWGRIQLQVTHAHSLLYDFSECQLLYWVLFDIQLLFRWDYFPSLWVTIKFLLDLLISLLNICSLNHHHLVLSKHLFQGPIYLSLIANSHLICDKRELFL
jgi:hypothetical protein